MTLEELISPDMLHANRVMHLSPEGFGGSGHRHAEIVIDFANGLKAQSILDYGCGECTLSKRLRKLKFRLKPALYDPGMPKFAKLPKAADLVVCTDVLEHVEPDKLNAVIEHIYKLSIKGAYLAIATRPANKLLPDGRNAHLIIEDTPYWIDRIKPYGWKILNMDDRRKGNGSGHEVRVWLTKQ